MNFLNSHRYFLRPEKIIQYKGEFYKQTCSRSGDQDQLNQEQLILFLKKMGFQTSHSDLYHFSSSLFRQSGKRMFNCIECIIILGRLAVTEQIQKQFQDVFDIFDIHQRGIITAEDIAKGLERAGVHLESKEVDGLFAELDYDGDGILNFEEFMCAMISK